MLEPRTFLVDTSVWLDLFLQAEPQRTEIEHFFVALCEHDGVLLYTPTSLKDVFYLVPRRQRARLVAQGIDVTHVSFSPYAWACVEKMTDIAVAAGQALPECSMAWMLRNDHPDLEDNLIIAAAETSGADYVVTYDKRLQKDYAPVCITPSQALRLLELQPNAGTPDTGAAVY